MVLNIVRVEHKLGTLFKNFNLEMKTNFKLSAFIFQRLALSLFCFYVSEITNIIEMFSFCIFFAYGYRLSAY